MYIKRIEIQNFKGIEDKKFEFNSNFTALIGDNGTGKTSILDAINIAIGTILLKTNSKRKLKLVLKEYTELIKEITYRIIPSNLSLPHFRDDSAILTLAQIINHIPKWLNKTNDGYDTEGASNEFAHRFLQGYSQ